MEEQEYFQFDIDSYEDAVAFLKELEMDLAILGKRIRIAMDQLREAMAEKLWTGVKKQGQLLGRMLEEAFQVDTVEDYNRAAAIYGTQLAGTLYQLSASFGGLKIAIIQAVAPLVELLVPVVKVAVEILTALANAIGTVLRLLFRGGEASESYAGGMQSAVSAGNALKRSLAGFDQINRLSKPTGIGGGVSVPTLTVKPLTGPWKEFADKLAQLMEPLQKIDLTPLSRSLERLKKALEPLSKALFAALEWAWYNIFVPMAKWAVEEFLPEYLDNITAAMENMSYVIGELKPSFLWLWTEYLKPLAQWKADELIRNLSGVTNGMMGLANSFFGGKSAADSFIYSGQTLLSTIADLVKNYMQAVETEQTVEASLKSLVAHLLLTQTPFGDTNTNLGIMGNILLRLAESFGLVDQSSNTTWNNMQKIWSGAWSFMKENLTAPAEEGFKGVANSMLSMVNGMVYSATEGMNALAKALNQIKFKVPDWIPNLGGKKFGFQIPSVASIRIPHLAKGAVLPANQPFLAVVGDQKRGTNVEAPLATIQEAVAQVMGEYTDASMAGHKATVDILQEILRAVLGIRIGDEVIAAAVSRYDRKMAIVRGGFI